MKILQIGCGNMGIEILKKYCNSVSYFDIVSRKKIENFNNYYENLSELPNNIKYDVIILAVKPQQIQDIIVNINSLSGQNTHIISILAGTKIDYFIQNIKNLASITRIMPNLGIKNDCGVSLLYGNCQIPHILDFIEQIFGNKNILLRLNTEDEIDNITPISGSGAAYFLLLGKFLVQYTTENLNINRNVAEKIVKNLLQSSINLVNDNNFETGINKIASKKGITQAVIDAMEEGLFENLQNGIQAGIEVAHNFSK